MQTLSPSLRIGVIRGGISPEYEVSLKTGANILKHLSETHRPADIFISKDGKWHINGIERNPERILKQVDVVYNALHGKYGEDGGIQDVLDHHKIPYTGSNKFSSALAMNKFLTKERAKKVGIKTPIYLLLRSEEEIPERLPEIHKTFSYPLVIKPANGGSSVGMTIARNPQQILEGLEKALSYGGSALVEEYISGKEASCGVIQNYRDQDIYVLPPIEIVHGSKNGFFDYDAKYNGQSREVCPGIFTSEEKKEIEKMSALIHETLGLRHYSRSDFVISPKRGVYFLEVNTLPGLTSESLFPKALEAVGFNFKDFLHHTLSMAVC